MVVFSSRFYVSQIDLCFEYLHSLNIIYRDLKPENLLIWTDGYVMLADLGLSNAVERRTFTICGTPEYMAPGLV
jgi:protein kinase A